MDRKAAMEVIYAVDGQGKPIPCDVTFCTLSTTRKTGGEIRTLTAVVPTNSLVELKRNRMVNLVPVADKGQRRGTEHHVHLCLIMAVNGNYINAHGR